MPPRTAISRVELQVCEDLSTWRPRDEIGEYVSAFFLLGKSLLRVLGCSLRRLVERKYQAAVRSITLGSDNTFCEVGINPGIERVSIGILGASVIVVEEISFCTVCVLPKCGSLTTGGRGVGRVQASERAIADVARSNPLQTRNYENGSRRPHQIAEDAQKDREKDQHPDSPPKFFVPLICDPERPRAGHPEELVEYTDGVSEFHRPGKVADGKAFSLSSKSHGDEIDQRSSNDGEPDFEGLRHELKTTEQVVVILVESPQVFLGNGRYKGKGIKPAVPVGTPCRSSNDISREIQIQQGNGGYQPEETHHLPENGAQPSALLHDLRVVAEFDLGSRAVLPHAVF